ncbi:MAG: flagellin [Candidatus Krumholzibacteria bacterium]|jgi:flagellin|nr:flagellin [Candidatus Krumholzibacteria bacterium]
MGLRINTNVASLNSQRHLFNTTNKFNKSMEKLSSGMRINRSGDDAAGLAISEGLKSDIRALDQASRNAADGISLVQVAEGALDEVNNILLRMRELSEQAATETLGEAERGYLDQEYQELLSEIDRISATAEFNGINLLDGTAGNLDVQVGIGTDVATSAVSINLSNAMDTAYLALASTSLVGSPPDGGDTARALIGWIRDASGTVSQTRAAFGAAQNRLETSIRNIAMTAENLAAANSRIRDVDVATETSTMTSLQILQQAGVAVLAQANMTSQLALNLLQR